jgi:CSLREA domain-containing protein
VAVAFALALPAGASAADIAVTDPSDSSADNGLCSLREAVQSANVNGSANADCTAGQPTMDRISIDSGETWTMGNTAGDNTNVAGDLDVNGAGPVTIASESGSTAGMIDCNDQDRAIHALDTDTGDTLTLEGIRITDCRSNNVIDGGGALRVDPNATVVVNDSTLEMNDAGIAGGNNDSRYGGAIYAWGRLVVNSSVIASNDTHSVMGESRGGGIAATSTANVTITRSVISGNQAHSGTNGGTVSGGGVESTEGAMQIRDSLISGNSLDSSLGNKIGGGVTLGTGPAGSSSLTNSTVTGNTAASGQFAANQGGEVYVGDDAPAEIVHSTLAGVTGTTVGDALYSADNDATPAVVVRGSILTSADPADVCAFPSMVPTLTSGGYNVEPSAECELAGMGDAQSVDPALGPLADNGGPTVGAPGFTRVLQTHAIASGGPAVDRAPAPCLDEGGDPLTTDQRGLLRPSPSNGRCDSGAYELTQAEPPPIGGSPPETKPSKKCKPKKKKGKKKPRKCKKKKRKKK